MKKKNGTAWLWITLGFFLALAPGLGVQAAEKGGHSGAPMGGGGSGEIPTPFLSSNQKVELSDGELYTLVGDVIFWNELAFFKVDLSQHTWLANSRRLAVPFYPLESSATYWRRFEGKHMRVYVEAHGHVVNDSSGSPQYIISLAPLADPVPADARSRQRH